MKRTPLKQLKPLLVVKLEKAYAKFAAVRDSVPSTAASTSSTAAAAATAAPNSSVDGDVKPAPAPSAEGENKPPVAVAPMSPTKKLEHEKKLRASQHNYHKFLKMATTTLSEREITMCPPDVITEIRARKHRVGVLTGKGFDWQNERSMEKPVRLIERLAEQSTDLLQYCRWIGWRIDWLRFIKRKIY